MGLAQIHLSQIHLFTNRLLKSRTWCGYHNNGPAVEIIGLQTWRSSTSQPYNGEGGRCCVFNDLLLAQLCD